MDFRLFCLLVFVVGLFVFESWRTRTYGVSGRVARFSKGLDRLLLLVPVLAAAVFAVLFLFVLKGRFYERLCHAALVLALWLYAARFYWMAISFFRYKKVLVLSIIALIGAAYSAILLTPLDRYVSLIHSVLGRASVLAGAGMLVLFYAAGVLRLTQNRKRG